MLTQADIDRMRAEHANYQGECMACISGVGMLGIAINAIYPCDAARLLDFISAYDLRTIIRRGPGVPA